MMPLLKNSGSRDLENVVAHAKPSYTRPSGASLPSNVAFNSDFGGSCGPSFFERLFGGPPTPARPDRPAAAATGDHPLTPLIPSGLSEFLNKINDLA